MPAFRPWYAEETPILSATQVDVFSLCERKWGFTYVIGVKYEPNEYAQFGIAVDNLLSGWLSTGKSFDTSTHEGQVALRAIPVLPKPGTPTLKVQSKFYLKLPSATFVGYKDLEYIDLEGRFGVAGEPVVEDHKTTVDPTRWAKTADQLRVNTQAILYAADAISKHKFESVTLKWNYYSSRKPSKPHVVQVRVERAAVEEQAKAIDKIAKHIIATYAKAAAFTTKYDGELKDAEREFVAKLTPNPEACEAFGGCPFRSQCNLTSSERMVALMAGNSLLDKMNARKAQQQGASAAAAAPAASPAPAPAAPSAAPTAAAAPSVSAPKRLAPKAPKLSATAPATAPEGNGANVNPPVSASATPAAPPPAASEVVPPPAAAPAAPRGRKAAAGAAAPPDGDTPDLVRSIVSHCEALRTKGVTVETKFTFKA